MPGLLQSRKSPRVAALVACVHGLWVEQQLEDSDRADAIDPEWWVLVTNAHRPSASPSNSTISHNGRLRSRR